VPVITPHVLLEGGADVIGSEQARAALEATRRLRSSMGERVALVACLPGPTALVGGGDTLLEATKAFLAAGVDAVVVLEGHDEPSDLGTLANVARFHRAVALGCCAAHGLPTVERVPLAAPRVGVGLILTDEDLPREIDVTDLEDWVDAVRG
jgi:hypothetical protein